MHALPEELADRSFTVEEGLRAGLSRWQLDRSGLRVPLRGLRTGRSISDDAAARCQEIRPILGKGAVFSHATALDLLGVDRPHGLRRADALHIEVPIGSSRPRHRGIVVHTRQRSRVPVMLRDGLPVTVPERLFVQLVSEVSPCEAVVLADALLRRRGALTSVRMLRSHLERLPPGTRGVRRAAAALADARSGTDSPEESRLRWAIVRAGLPCPEVNTPVLDAAGRVVALPDLSYPDRRLAIEYDGDVHRVDRRTWRRDITRRQNLEALGWRIITCTGDDLPDADRALARIRAVLSRPTPS